jgi:hypothetical protein
MKSNWIIQWASSTAAFAVVLICLYFDDFFGDMASGTSFWVMIGVVLALVSGASAAFFRQHSRKK